MVGSDSGLGHLLVRHTNVPPYCCEEWIIWRIDKCSLLHRAIYVMQTRRKKYKSRSLWGSEPESFRVAVKCYSHCNMSNPLSLLIVIVFFYLWNTGLLTEFSKSALRFWGTPPPPLKPILKFFTKLVLHRKRSFKPWEKSPNNIENGQNFTYPVLRGLITGLAVLKAPLVL